MGRNDTWPVTHAGNHLGVSECSDQAGPCDLAGKEPAWYGEPCAQSPWRGAVILPAALWPPLHQAGPTGRTRVGTFIVVAACQSPDLWESFWEHQPVLKKESSYPEGNKGSNHFRSLKSKLTTVCTRQRI